MNKWRKNTVMVLVVCLLHLLLVDVGLAANETVSTNPGLAGRQVGQFGVGAKIKVELASGRKFKGSIQSVDEGGFLLALAKARAPTRIAYGDVAQVRLANNTYNAKGRPDAVEAKRVAAGLRVGHHIIVKTAQGNEYHGKIVAIAADSFSMLPDHTTAPVQIGYNNVRQMGPNLSKGEKITLIVVVAVAIVVTVFVVWFATNAD